MMMMLLLMIPNSFSFFVYFVLCLILCYASMAGCCYYIRKGSELHVAWRRLVASRELIKEELRIISRVCDGTKSIVSGVFLSFFAVHTSSYVGAAISLEPTGNLKKAKKVRHKLQIIIKIISIIKMKINIIL